MADPSSPGPADRAQEERSRIGPARTADSGPGELLRDLQSLLGHGVARLIAATGPGRGGGGGAAAWAVREDGRPYVAAAHWDGPAPAAPSAEIFAAAAALPGARDLSGSAIPAGLRRFARQEGYAAAAPVRAGRVGVAVLLLGAERGGAVRPRALAALEARATRLSGPLAGALALARLDGLADEAQRLDGLATLGSLVGEVAHELRNPLVSLKTFLQLLPERRDDPEFTTGFLEVANDELRRMERLLDLLIAQAATSRQSDLPDGAPKSSEGEGDAQGALPADAQGALPADAVEAVATLARLRARGRNVEITTQCEAELPVLALDGDALRQVLLNLVLNAIDASPPGGVVRVTAHRPPSRSAGGRGAAVEFAVRDEGPGVPVAERERIFEPFVSTRRGRPGGLGLAISRRLVERAGGTLRVQPAPTSDTGGTGGTEFRLRINPKRGRA